jgi:hypothetical protein
VAQKTEDEKREEDELKLLEWAEKSGIANLHEHIKSLELLKEGSVKTLTILNAAGAATLAYVMKSLDEGHYNATFCGAVIMLFYLFALSGKLVTRCLVIGEVPTASNEPQNLTYKDQPYANALREEIANMANRIKELIERNDQIAIDLNGIRFAALWSPMLFLLGLLIKLFAG